MKRLLFSLLLLISSVSLTFAQVPTKLCIPTSSADTNCVTVNVSNPLPVTGSFSASTAATATAAAPSYVEGTDNSISQNLTGDLRTIAKQSGTWNVTNISGTVSLPTGASTSANQTSQITQETSLNTALGVIGDSAWVSGNGTVISVLKNIAGGVGSSIPAGTNTIGNAVNAPTASSSLAVTGVTCGSAVSSCVLKASAGNFYGVYAECTSACWLMVFNATSAPSNGATTAGTASGNLVECIDVAANSSKSLNYPTFPRAYSVGITAAISSTACATLTLSTVGFVSGTVL